MAAHTDRTLVALGQQLLATVPLTGWERSIITHAADNLAYGVPLTRYQRLRLEGMAERYAEEVQL